MSLDEKNLVIESPKQSTTVSKSVNILRDIVEDIPTDKDVQGSLLLVRKFWFRMVLYSWVSYETQICFLGIGKDSMCKPFKKSLCIDLNEGENIDITMNIEDDMDLFFRKLKENKIDVLVMEGVSTYLKPETMKRIIDFVKLNNLKFVFDASCHSLNQFLTKNGIVKDGIFNSCLEDYRTELGELFSIVNTKKILDFFGFFLDFDLEYYFMVHNFTDDCGRILFMSDERRKELHQN